MKGNKVSMSSKVGFLGWNRTDFQVTVITLHRRPFISLYSAKPPSHPLTFSTWRWWRWCRGYHCRQTAARLRCQRRDSLSSLWLMRRPRVWTLVSPPTLGAGGDRSARVWIRSLQVILNHLWYRSKLKTARLTLTGMQSFQPAFLCLLIGLWRRIVGDRQTSLASPRPACERYSSCIC